MNSRTSVPAPMPLTLWQDEERKPDFYRRLHEVDSCHTPQTRNSVKFPQIVLLPWSSSLMTTLSSPLPLASKNLNRYAPPSKTQAQPLGGLIPPPASGLTAAPRSTGPGEPQSWQDHILSRAKGTPSQGAKHRPARRSRDGVSFIFLTTNLTFLDESGVKLSIRP